MFGIEHVILIRFMLIKEVEGSNEARPFWRPGYNEEDGK